MYSLKFLNVKNCLNFLKYNFLYMKITLCIYTKKVVFIFGFETSPYPANDYFL